MFFLSLLQNLQRVGKVAAESFWGLTGKSILLFNISFLPLSLKLMYKTIVNYFNKITQALREEMSP